MMEVVMRGEAAARRYDGGRGERGGGGRSDGHRGVEEVGKARWWRATTEPQMSQRSTGTTADEIKECEGV